MSSDEGVIATNDDATACKRYAAEKGYWKDDFIQYFCRKPERKAPEINRGYFARVKAVRLLVDQFLQLTNAECQVVNIGAGFDTLFWKLQCENALPKGGFFEVDLKPVVTRKCMAIKSKRQLHAAFPEGGLVIANDEADSSFYHLIAADIRNIDELDSRLTESGLKKDMPTLFIAECVLVYLEPDQSLHLMRWMAKNFRTALLINYEPFNLNDRFGSVMLHNLQSRHCALLGAAAFPTLDALHDRHLSAGWQESNSIDMLDAYKKLPKEAVDRIIQLEFLDEIDLLFDLLKHYALTCAYNDTRQLGLASVVL